MSGKTKILVLHMREVIYTGIFIFLGLIFLILLAVMFLPRQSASTSSSPAAEGTTESVADHNASSSKYMPGIYTAALEVSGSNLEMQVIVEQTGITDVSFTQLDETIETMYPLFTPVLESIALQLQSGVDLKAITYEESQKYTANVLLKALEEVLETAAK